MPRAAKVEEVRNVVESPSKLKLMSHAHNLWSVHADEGTIPADVAKSDYWSLMSAKIRPFDKFEVIAGDGTWRVEGTIVSCGRTWAQVHVDNTIHFGKVVEPAKSETHEVKWRGPELMWCVIRTQDGAVIQEKLDTKEIANTMLMEHESKVR